MSGCRLLAMPVYGEWHMTQPCCGSGLTRAWASIVICMYVLHMWHPGTLLTRREPPLMMSLSNCYVTLQMRRYRATCS